VPFREQVINFPARSAPESLERPHALPRINTNLQNGPQSALSPPGRTSLSSPTARTPGKPATTPGATGQPLKPEDNKDSPEYKKKQALAAGPVLTMDYENSKTYGMTESLFTSLKDIFEAVIANRSRMGVVSPHKFLEILRRDNEMFRTPMHQDAHEFLNLLLNEVVENVETFSKSRITEVGETEQNDAVIPTTNHNNTNTGWVHELFEGTLTSETRCLTCENTSQRDEAFLDLSVDLEQHSSVTSCLRKFSEEEMLCERNKFHCDNCGGLQEAEKRMKIKRLPKILALHLKRFKYTEDLQRLQKLFHRVVYPYYLRLFNTTDDAEDPDRLYELYAVVVHIGGGPYHGHYVSIIKTQDRGWLLFDDEMVEPVDKAYVRNFFGGENVLACAYVLFYQETTEEAMMKEQEADAREAAAKQASELNPEAVAVSATTPKANGTPNGFGHAHHLSTAQTPTIEEEDQFASLNHAATAPALNPNEHAHPVEHVTTNIPVLGARKSNAGLGLFGKKNKAEEKERKAAEKELEAQAKQKRKEMETQRRNNYRRQQDELEAALAASRESAAEESKKRGTEDSSAAPAAAGAGEKKDANGVPGTLGKASGLSRFRHSSMSLKGKPKFWSSKDKADGNGHGHGHGNGIGEVGEGGNAAEGDEKKGHGLGRKKSVFKF
jgi:ubiquitin carboxyl-terminal hydrolase 9/13